MKSIIVNHLVILSLFFIIFFSNCGFQLNRNRIELKNGASSLHIQKVVNRSFSPTLDIKLKKELKILLNSKEIPLISRNQADLVINIEILNYIITKTKYAIDPDTNIQSYQFKFQLTGEMQLIDNKGINQNILLTNEQLFENKKIKANINLISQNQDLDEEEKQSGKKDVIVKLASVILKKLTNDF